jgi:hypothetical protein
MSVDRHLTGTRAILLLALDYGFVPADGQIVKCDALCAEGWDEYMAAWIVASHGESGAAASYPRRDCRRLVAPAVEDRTRRGSRDEAGPRRLSA